MERGPHLTDQPTRRDSGEERDQDEEPEEQHPIRCDRVRRDARWVDDSELRDTRVFELPGEARGFAT